MRAFTIRGNVPPESSVHERMADHRRRHGLEKERLIRRLNEDLAGEQIHARCPANKVAALGGEATRRPAVVPHAETDGEMPAAVPAASSAVASIPRDRPL